MQQKSCVTATILLSVLGFIYIENNKTLALMDVISWSLLYQTPFPSVYGLKHALNEVFYPVRFWSETTRGPESFQN
jgi:hypothetical protein